MSRLKHPAHPWQRDCLVVAVDTIELNGERVPLSYSQLTVEDHRITTSLFHPIAWMCYRWGRDRKLTQEELSQAVASAHTYRKLVPEDLREGDAPWNVFSLIEKVFRCACRHDSLVVMHDPGRDLPVLMDAVEAWMDVDLPPVSVVSTGVLERARRLGLRQDHGETAAAFYRRMAGVDSPLPDLLPCLREQELVDPTPGPDDRLFPVMATFAVYQQHFGARLLGAPACGPKEAPR